MLGTDVVLDISEPRKQYRHEIQTFVCGTAFIAIASCVPLRKYAHKQAYVRSRCWYSTTCPPSFTFRMFCSGPLLELNKVSSAFPQAHEYIRKPNAQHKCGKPASRDPLLPQQYGDDSNYDSVCVCGDRSYLLDVLPLRKDVAVPLLLDFLVQLRAQDVGPSQTRGGDPDVADC